MEHDYRKIWGVEKPNRRKKRGGSNVSESSISDEEFQDEKKDQNCAEPPVKFENPCIVILDALEGYYASLSMQKFSSNVVEKILMIGPDCLRKKVIDELMDSNHLSQ